MDNNMLNNNAQNKFVTANPLIKYPAKSTIIALTIKRNNPSVTIVSGIVKMINIGRTSVLSIPSVMATNTAVM